MVITTYFLFLFSDAVSCYKENTESVVCEWMWLWSVDWNDTDWENESSL